MNIGQITRSHTDSVSWCCGPLKKPFSGVDRKLAIESYRFLIKKGETITTLCWIKRIRKIFAKSSKRNTIIREIVIASCNDAQAIKRVERVVKG